MTGMSLLSLGVDGGSRCVYIHGGSRCCVKILGVVVVYGYREGGSCCCVCRW